MRRLFGEKKKPPPPAENQLNEAQMYIDNQLAYLDSQILYCENGVKQLTQAATPLSSSSRQRCLALLRRKKLLDEHRQRLLGTQLTLHQVQFSHQSARASALTLEALELGTRQMKQELEKLDVKDVAGLPQDLAELATEQQRISEALTLQSAMPELFDEAELEAELNRLVADANEGRKRSSDVSTRCTQVNTTQHPSERIAGHQEQPPLPFDTSFPDALFPPVPQHAVGNVFSPVTSKNSGTFK